MTQRLWLLNSSLLAIFFLALIISNVLRIDPPRVRIKKASQDIEKDKKEDDPEDIWHTIYKKDLFKTFQALPTTEPTKKNLVTPIPQPPTTSATPPPEPPKQEFIDALTLSVKGIILAADQLKSVAMIEDESEKESLFHLGDKIKDGQIIKITRNKVVILRANGQQEVFFLRKDDPALNTEEEENKWNYIIKKIDDTTFNIDPDAFKREVESLGNFIERTSTAGTVYIKDNPVGIRIGSLKEGDLGSRLGLQENDIIMSINDIPTAQTKNRIKIYDNIKAMNIDSTIKAAIKRDNEKLIVTYDLVRISKAKKKLFTGEKEEKAEPKKEDLKQSKTQEREQKLREFNQRHPRDPQQQQAAIARIRERLLNNLRSRMKNVRSR